MTVSTRRAVLGGAAGLVVAPAPGPTAARHPDAALLAACDAFYDLEGAYLATGFGHEIGSSEEAAADAEQERLSLAQAPLVARMCELRAVTREGQAARARSLALWDAELMKPGKVYTNDRLMAAIVRDLLAAVAA